MGSNWACKNAVLHPYAKYKRAVLIEQVIQPGNDSYQNLKSASNDDPTTPKRAQQAIMLHTFGGQGTISMYTGTGINKYTNHQCANIYIYIYIYMQI